MLGIILNLYHDQISSFYVSTVSKEHANSIFAIISNRLVATSFNKIFNVTASFILKWITNSRESASQAFNPI